jgi:hypothetical protein
MTFRRLLRLAEASHLSDVIAEQKQHVVNEWAKEAEETS